MADYIIAASSTADLPDEYFKEHNIPLDFVSTHQYIGDPFMGVSAEEAEKSFEELQAEELSGGLTKGSGIFPDPSAFPDPVGGDTHAGYQQEEASNRGGEGRLSHPRFPDHPESERIADGGADRPRQPQQEIHGEVERNRSFFSSCHFLSNALFSRSYRGIETRRLFMTYRIRALFFTSGQRSGSVLRI